MGEERKEIIKEERKDRKAKKGKKGKEKMKIEKV